MTYLKFKFQHPPGPCHADTAPHAGGRRGRCRAVFWLSLGGYQFYGHFCAPLMLGEWGCQKAFQLATSLRVPAMRGSDVIGLPSKLC